MHPALIAYPTPYTVPPHHLALLVDVGAAPQQLLHHFQLPAPCCIDQRGLHPRGGEESQEREGGMQWCVGIEGEGGVGGRGT